VVITVLLIVVGVILAVAAYAISSGIIGGASSTPTLQTQASVIKAEYKNNTGIVYLSVVNSGAGAVQISSITITDKAGASYTITFGASSVTDASSTATATNLAYSGSVGVGIGGTTGNYFMVVPSGGQLSITGTFDGSASHKVTDLFDVGGSYSSVLHPVSGSDILFSIRCVSF